MRWTLRRIWECDTATVGLLEVGEERPLWTLELAWRENRRNISRIPANIYRVHVSPTNRGRLRLGGTGVSDEAGTAGRYAAERFAVDIHTANRTSELKGCIAVGLGVDILAPQPNISNSAAAMATLLGIFQDYQPVSLQIVNQF